MPPPRWRSSAAFAGAQGLLIRSHARSCGHLPGSVARIPLAAGEGKLLRRVHWPPVAFMPVGHELALGGQLANRLLFEHHFLAVSRYEGVDSRLLEHEKGESEHAV